MCKEKSAALEPRLGAPERVTRSSGRRNGLAASPSRRALLFAHEENAFHGLFLREQQCDREAAAPTIRAAIRTGGSISRAQLKLNPLAMDIDQFRDHGVDRDRPIVVIPVVTGFRV